MRNLEHSYTHILAAFDKVKRTRDNIARLRQKQEAAMEPIDLADMVLECQQDLLKVLSGLI